MIYNMSLNKRLLFDVCLLQKNESSWSSYQAFQQDGYRQAGQTLRQEEEVRQEDVRQERVQKEENCELQVAVKDQGTPSLDVCATLPQGSVQSLGKVHTATLRTGLHVHAVLQVQHEDSWNDDHLLQR